MLRYPYFEKKAGVMALSRCSDAARICTTIEVWLLRRVKGAKAAGGIVGLSGGIDSAVVAVLLKRVFGANMLAVYLPCDSLDSDREDALMVVESFALPFMEVDLSTAFKSLERDINVFLSQFARANIKPRLRMTVLYALAQSNNYLVCGTDNKAERQIGYFTKYGDGGCDLLPIGDLLKSEVRLLAGYLEIPEPLIKKPPSAGLWPGQTDEAEIGLAYDQIDAYFSSGIIDEEAAERIERLQRASEHKRVPPPVCIISPEY